MQQLHDVVSQAFLLRQAYDRLVAISTSPHAQQPKDIAKDLQRIEQEHDNIRQEFESRVLQHGKLVQRISPHLTLPSEWQQPPTFPLLRNALDASLKLAELSSARSPLQGESRYQAAAPRVNLSPEQTEQRQLSSSILKTSRSSRPEHDVLGQLERSVRFAQDDTV
jgi:hypothetical protein